ncbi:Serine/threonine-protein_phosphatase [Hexamita inflata]|uniref:Serine/threonine-protein phosphatase n=1 Tax=Hexamita inflata TaxID=28002 RepID=A0AA86P242_9EUKA|nr:Serine/threonine-protein phosphatase [Hexamita inflata]CAI9929760.1 Serine/threonine-protein phosphatase [Hexamita inflata]
MNIDQIIEFLMEERPPGMEVDIKAEQVDYVCDAFMQLPAQAHVEIEAPCYIIGDVHAQYYDILTYFKKFGIENVKYVFLGDYVDRGYQAIETLMLLFCFKIKYPDNFILLRGNHELADVCTSYSYNNCLLAEVQERFQSEEIILKLLKVFDYLTLSCAISKKILCVHGCVTSKITSISQIQEINLPFNPCGENSELAELVKGLLWSDPISDLESKDLAIDNYFNIRRGIGELVPEHIISEFLANNNFDVLMRGHEAPEDGFKVGVSGKVWTVFGASNYYKQVNQVQGSVVCEIQKDLGLKMHIFRSDIQ